MEKKENKKSLAVYVDGFSLHYGIKEKHPSLYWVNLKSLVLNSLKPYQRFVHMRYFTARIKGSQVKSRSQQLYFNALSTLSDFSLHRGFYQIEPQTCPLCKGEYGLTKEKMSDVLLASHLLYDAFDNKYDEAIVVSGDADISGAIEVIREKLPDKRIIVAFPPSRESDRLRKTAHSCFHIGRDKLFNSQFPDPVLKIDSDGKINKIEKPSSWF